MQMLQDGFLTLVRRKVLFANTLPCFVEVAKARPLLSKSRKPWCRRPSQKLILKIAKIDFSKRLSRLLAPSSLLRVGA